MNNLVEHLRTVTSVYEEREELLLEACRIAFWDVFEVCNYENFGNEVDDCDWENQRDILIDRILNLPYYTDGEDILETNLFYGWRNMEGHRETKEIKDRYPNYLLPQVEIPKFNA